MAFNTIGFKKHPIYVLEVSAHSDFLQAKIVIIALVRKLRKWISIFQFFSRDRSNLVGHIDDRTEFRFHPITPRAQLQRSWRHVVGSTWCRDGRSRRVFETYSYLRCKFVNSCSRSMLSNCLRLGCRCNSGSEGATMNSNDEFDIWLTFLVVDYDMK